MIDFEAAPAGAGGWMFPVTVLDENGEIFIVTSHQKDYRIHIKACNSTEACRYFSRGYSVPFEDTYLVI